MSTPTHLSRRTLVLAIALVALASLVAAGCGGGGSDSIGGGGSSILEDAAGLDYVADSALFVGVVSADLEGDEWDDVWSLIRRLDDDAPASPGEAIDEGSSEDDVRWSDVREWIGDTAGLAVTDASADEMGLLAWVEVTDEDAAEESITKDIEGIEFSDEGDWRVGEAPDGDSWYAIGDDLVIVANRRETIDGLDEDVDSIRDLDAYDELAGRFGGATVAAGFVNAPGLVDLVEENADDAVDGATACVGQGSEVVDAATGIAFGLAADDGRLVGATYVQTDGSADLDELMPVSGTDLTGSLPADTVATITVSDLGGRLTALLEGLASEECAGVTGAGQLAMGLATGGIAAATGNELEALEALEQLEGVDGIDAEAIAELEGLLEGDDLGMGSEMGLPGRLGGLGQLLGGLADAQEQVSGAAQLGEQLKEVTGLDPDQYADLMPGEAVIAVGKGAPVPGIAVAWESEDEDLSRTFTGTIVEQAAGMVGAQPSDSEIAGLEARSTVVPGAGLSLIGAVGDDIGVIATSEAIVQALGGTGDSLADTPAFTDALDAAKVPSEVSAMLWLDFRSIADLTASLGALAGGGADDTTDALRRLESLVAWAGTDGDTLVYHGYLQPAAGDDE